MNKGKRGAIMQIEEVRKGQIVILRINGRLDSTNSSELDITISNLVARMKKQY